ncbi:MAG TPA: S9 family peptidase [Actinomycetaceae bacterium]|nr:S9 family peptidase [Actinomycetaceae bacterium]
MSSRPYGSWPSPLSAEDVTGGALRLSSPRIDGRSVYWKERHADGRSVLGRATDGVREELPSTFDDGAPIDVASRVHEYGGGDFAVDGGVVVFSARRDDRLYVTNRGEEGWSTPRAVTADDNTRYADLTLQGHTVYAVAEEHRGVTANDVMNRIVAIDITTGAVSTLREGPDFVANPRPSPDGAALAWYEWDHPDMPWDAAALYAARLDGGSLGPQVVHIAGRTNPPRSAISPVWVANDELVFVHDPDGWWNLFRCSDPLGACRIRPLHPAEAEFAVPPWTFDSSVTALDEDHVIAKWTRHGRWSLGSIQIANGTTEEWMTGLEPVSEIAVGDGIVAFVGSSGTAPAVLVELTLAEGRVRVLRESAPRLLDDDYVSVAEAIDWSSGSGTAHGFFYTPTNPDVDVPDGELPPVLVLVHGGPTSATSAGYSSFVQFWTTRGFAVLDVNYRGSTGYGREYRESLNGRWGLVDIEDVASGVAALADLGLVDGNRAVIRGGSAGGYTVLRALTATDTFAAGTSRYGIADLAILAAETHKFESRYTERLVGPYPAAATVYRDRSPLYHLEDLTAPVLLLHGEEDKVVPPSQAIKMAEAIDAAGGDVELVMYPGEGHGFRTAEVARDALEREYEFYGRVLGFLPN